MSTRRAATVRTLVLGTLALSSLAACRRKPVAAAPAPVAADSSANRDAEAARRDSIARAERERADRDALAAQQRQREQALAAARGSLTAPVYFDYDAASLRDDSRQQLEAKLPLLTANPSLRLRVAGHTDERGSDEYNLALGQRRAASVKAFFAERGVDASRLDIVSFGKERPTCESADETCFGRNRRAEFEVTAGGESLATPQ
jgi:peptidoglycan-associated lipoprotein